MTEIYHFKKIFKYIEKATKKCIHSNVTIEYYLSLTIRLQLGVRNEEL